MSDLSSDLITVTEAAALLGVTTRTIRRWIDAGYLPGHRLTPRSPYMTSRTAVDALLKARRDALKLHPDE